MIPLDDIYIYIYIYFMLLYNSYSKLDEIQNINPFKYPEKKLSINLSPSWAIQMLFEKVIRLFADERRVRNMTMENVSFF